MQTPPEGGRGVDSIPEPNPVPHGFLAGPPDQPVSLRHIDFSSDLPEYVGYTAFILDNVLSPSECKQLLALAESSVPRTEDTPNEPWVPALVSFGPGIERPAPGYRESDRIMWDEQEMVDRIWARCVQAEGVQALMNEVPDVDFQYDETWEFVSLNKRMRFLKYSPGQFFKPHCDGPVWYNPGDGEYMTFYTLQLYLNSSASTSDSASPGDFVGGATAFVSRELDRRLDVQPQAGRALIFQHSRLRHEGVKVETGIKYAMRTDIVYRRVDEKR